jgi:hypothetical protein
VRRRYIQRDGVLIEVPLNYAPPPPNTDSVLWNDRPYQDMNDPRFSSRSQHREFMKREGLTTVDDFKDNFKQAREKRLAFYRGEDASRKEDVARALEKHRG